MTAELAILACGMVTAVGLDAPSACAAMRARLDGFQETRFQSGPDEPVVGAPVPITHEMLGERRMAYMAAAAIRECLDALPEARAAATHLILCVAEADRPGSPVGDNARLAQRIGALLARPANGPTRVISEGRPSGHAALRTAARLLANGEAEYVVIAGVDSYLTSGTITHFLGENRLLTPDNANGFIPGEAAAAILCGAAKRGAFQLAGLGLSREPAFIYNGLDEEGAHLPLRGDGMTAAYRDALSECGIEMAGLGYRIADLIGEQYWFKQSALASIRLVRGAHGFQDVWSPAESLGNVGAAVVPVMIAMAMTAAAKGYSGGTPVLVEASSDSGACGAAVFSARVQ
ncbi:beta-ketoacyl synthase N-terminal-like domain-containing protein [Aminobacter niigataensis]|uniref:beta-ketoacyl synthase N-terminal-like domain-containing protein n=1 Tax=Aminobacter niigataensis TaxID=83265 RepID=UPI0024CA4643|nr:beta-ketoacyl synthase N-terminal-like domain-containing protein [Aminobacter niigataensis]CAI2934710.1 3-oxoacyl-(Acyl carrier protein) synthase [Aminobacter niigataensis]